MTHRRGLLLSAVLLLVTGCGVGTTTTETSMMRGPTPSSGMTIPRLLTASAPPNFSSGAESGAPESPPDPAGDPSAVETTEDIPPGSGEVEPLPTDDGAIPTDGLPTDIPTDELPTDLFPTDGSLPDDLLDPGAGVDLGAIAANFACADYVDQPALPLTTGSGVCALAGDSVQLYSFATDEDQGAFIEELIAQGVSIDSVVQADLFIVIPPPAQFATVQAALTAG